MQAGASERQHDHQPDRGAEPECPKPEGEQLALWLRAAQKQHHGGQEHGVDRRKIQQIERDLRQVARRQTGCRALMTHALAIGSGLTDRLKAKRTDRRQHQDTKHRPTLADRLRGDDSLWPALVAGVAYSVPGAYYLAGLALLVKLNAGTTSDLLAVLGFNLVMFALLELPILGFTFAPDQTRALVGRLDHWLSAHGRTILVVAAGAIGLYLLIAGILDLK